MKKIYTLIGATLISLATFSQADWVNKGEVVSEMELRDSTIKLDSTLYIKDLYIKNTSGADLRIKFRRDVLYSTGQFQAEQWCFGGDFGLCIPINPTGVSTWSAGDHTIASGDSVRIDYKVVGNGSHACITSRLFVLNYSDDSKIDSMDVNFKFGNCALGFDENESISSDISVYPNPANELLNFNVRLEGAQNAELVIVDMLGKQVYVNSVAANQTHKVNASNFKQGIYFYSLKVGNKVLETKKLVVKH